MKLSELLRWHQEKKVPASITAFPAVQQKQRIEKPTSCHALTMESRVFITNTYYKYGTNLLGDKNSMVLKTLSLE